jgi:hypothetical protein
MLLLSAPGYIVSLSTFVAEIYRKSEQTKGAIHTYTASLLKDSDVSSFSYKEIRAKKRKGHLQILSVCRGCRFIDLSLRLKPGSREVL